VLLMKDRVGEEFVGTVSALTDFGFFVELDDPWVEGLVKGESLGPFKFDKLTNVISYSSGLRIRVGERAKVRLLSANLQRQQLDFELIEIEGKRRKKEAQPRATARKGATHP